MGASPLALLFATLIVVAVTANVHPPIKEDELTMLVVKIKGDDNRLFRWDATEHTVEQQKNGACDQLQNAFEMIKSKDSSATMKRMACEYATFCITDNPQKREELSHHEGIHKALVDLVASGGSTSRYEDEETEGGNHDPETESALAAASAVSTMAAHLMYISTFANHKNQHTFFELGAIPALTSVIKGKHSTAVQIMWASAAMQNLAASYCDTDDDGRCYWDWVEEKEHVVILDEDTTKMISDGAKIREAILEDKELIETLKMLSCWGPVQAEEEEDEEVVYIGENAIIGRDDNNPAIIPWAAMGVLKNLALEPKAKALLEPIMHCICYMSGSTDWLEENKGGAALYHMRRSDPCWFVEDDDEEAIDYEGEDDEEEYDEDEVEVDEDGNEVEDEDDDDEYADDVEEDDYDEVADSASLILVCVDHNFYDAEGYHCDSYQDATDKECTDNTDVFTNLPASTACCECGGGDVQRSYYEEEEEE